MGRGKVGRVDTGYGPEKTRRVGRLCGEGGYRLKGVRLCEARGREAWEECVSV